MLSQHHPTRPLAPAPSPFNMAAYVLRHAKDMGDKVALAVVSAEGEDTIWTYAQLARSVEGVAAGLLRKGLVPGDRVLLRLGNTVDFPLAYLAAIHAGLVPVPTSSQLTEVEITKMAALVTPRLVIASEGIALPVEDPKTESLPVLTVQELHDMTRLAPVEPHMGDPNRPAYIIFTSGTSGQARAVAHAHRAIWARQMMWDGWYDISQDDRMMHAGAFNWTYTLGTGLMDPWTVGATSLIPAPGSTPEQITALLASHEATIFAAAPGVYRQMMKHDLPDLPGLRHSLSAGEKLPSTTRADWNARTGKKIYEAYGMSECSTFISGSPLHPAPKGTLGYPQAGRHVAVLGDDGMPVPRGVAGLMAVHETDPGLMLGYVGAEEATKLRFQGEWFVTGDTVVMEQDGAIRFEGRSDDIMNAGGFRVSPIEVEAAMALHPGVHEAACAEVAIKADATLIACFYLPEDGVVDEKLLSDHAHARLAHYKCPRLFIPVDTIPRGANNKILRARLREGFEAGNRG
ncbi:acyl--CoA ligase [Aliiroseovarius crassostreae]|uniref:class I adenylate-forming enzyme family protein n=1 Tax=Aliiroseovarius crassostreae TaxID=154981 RepID=UPI002208D950|nr:class I adenylate-forming enzyme family protein [Aliiroseovarius crassostreae]UWQ09202.1 acyl--CoA ligase [Aliiroseovarius crassostreae]UWQ12279.1 acyl--CoA ligase [Aliiroseovarius crassostreae]